MLSGRMEVAVGDARYLLGPGDGIWFMSDQPHTFSVVGDEECVSIWADTLPDHPGSSSDMPSVFAEAESEDAVDPANAPATPVAGS